MLQGRTNPKSVRFIVEVALVALAVTMSGILTVSSFIYPRSEAEKLEKRVDNLEENIDHRLERIEDKIDRLKK